LGPRNIFFNGENMGFLSSNGFGYCEVWAFGVGCWDGLWGAWELVLGRGKGLVIGVWAGSGFGEAHWENENFLGGDLGGRNLEKRSVADGQGPGDVLGVFGLWLGEVW
jgi:hypothetical protein